MMPKTTKGIETRNRILNAAARCITEIGIEQTSVTQIAKLAKVPRSLVARYVPKKADLLILIIEHWRQLRVRKEISHLPPLEAEIESQTNMTDYLTTNPHFATCVILVYYYSRIDPRMAKYCRQFSDSAEQGAIKRLVEENKIRGTNISRELLESFGVQLANMGSMHLIKRFTTPIKNKKKYDESYNQMVRHLWEKFFTP